MDEEIQRLRKVIAKTFRKAKRWYLGYVFAQFAVLAAALASLYIDVDARTSAVIAFLGVLITECVRWRSDYWKGEGDSAKRRWEIANGLGEAIDGGAVADWLALRSPSFLDDVTDEELSGSDFDSDEAPGPRRVITNTQESAWWSKHESRRIAWYLASVLVVMLGGIFVALTTVISRLQPGVAGSNPPDAQVIGAIICVVLAFAFSINIVRLLVDFVMFYHSSKACVERSSQLLQNDEPSQREALFLLFDYQISRSASPMLPTFIWKFHGAHLRAEWKRFRPG